MGREQNEIIVWMEDAMTKAPQEITRMVERCLKGDNSVEASGVRIFNRHSNWGEWKISNLVNKNTQ